MAAQTWCTATHPDTGDKCFYGGYHPKLPHTAKLSEVRTAKVAENGARYVLVTNTVFESWDHKGVIIPTEETE